MAPPDNGAMNTSTHSHNFSGLSDWFEVFRAGTQTDSQGRTKTFTEADLDSIVANHSGEQPAPLVVGHPKTNHPAYGWTAELKRDGDVLLAKAANVVPEFEQAVANKQYRHRSISIVPMNEGYQLRHIGFLGAVAPAVPGLKDIEFEMVPEGEVFEFAVNDAVQQLGWRMSGLGRVLRGIKNWFIEQNGAEAADQLIPEYTLDDLNETHAALNAAMAEPGLLENFSHELKTTFSNAPDDAAHDTNREDDMSQEKTYTEAELQQAISAATQPLQTQLDTLNKQAEQSAFNQRVNDAENKVEAWVAEGKILPSQKAGLKEFLANLPQEEVVIEFSLSEKESKQLSLHDYACHLIGSLNKQIDLDTTHVDADGDDTSHSYQAPSGMHVSEDRAELDKKAMAYSAEHGVDYITALQKVTEED